MKFIFNFPDLGEGLEEGTILKWFVSAGDRVETGDSLVQMETDKVVADIPSPKSGVILACHGEVGDVVRVGTALVDIEIAEDSGMPDKDASCGVDVNGNLSEAVPAEKDTDNAAVVGTMEVAADDALIPVSDEGAPSEMRQEVQDTKRVLATPVARAMAKEMGININQVPGSGPSGRVKKEDILLYAGGSSSQVLEGHSENNVHKEGDVIFKPLTQIRKTIARNMLYSKLNAAHMSVFEEVEISMLKGVVTKYKPIFSEKGVKLTYLAFVVKAVAQALKQHPQFNSRLDMENNRMIYRTRYHIAIAVDTPDGLVAPVIRDADRLSVFETAKRIGQLAERARERKLTLDEMKDGTFTITSFGSIGGIFATPVINYPQAGILGIGRIMKTPIVKDDQIVVGQIMPLSFTVDHRIVDGGETTRFVKRIMEYLSDPVALLMDE